MPRRATPLTAAKVRTAGPGRYGDGNGLYLLVRSKEAKSWIFRYSIAGRMREMGLGSAGESHGDVLLSEARAKAGELMKTVRAGGDPIADRAAEIAAAKANAQQQEIRRKTLRQVGDLFIASHEASWKNEKHRQQWSNTLRDYVYADIGDLPVIDVATPHILVILEPIWRIKPETASRVRGRVESILDYAKARGWRTGENPARWRGHLDNLLPSRRKLKTVEHHAALPFELIGSFMTALREQEGVAARALEFLILTVCRTNEVVGGKWPELNSRNTLWTVPPERMKAGREHRIPLPSAATDLLDRMNAIRQSDFIFPGARSNRPLSNMAMMMTLRRMGFGHLTVHGFRSTFRDWAAERTSFANEVAEMALAHKIDDEVEAAYRRGDLLEKRRKLAEAWAKYCGTPPIIAKVVGIGAGKS